MMLLDLSHTLENDQPHFATHTKFFRMMWNRLEFGDRSAHAQIIMGEHSGTHVDAPMHFYPESASIDALDLDHFTGLGRCVDAAFVGLDQTLSADDLLNSEKREGVINSGEIVLIHYGFDRWWQKGAEARRYRTAWPGLSEDAAMLLATRGVKAVGTDAISIDTSKDQAIVAHQRLLGAGVVIYENLTRLETLVGHRFRFWGMPLKIGGGTGSPVRAYAEILES